MRKNERRGQKDGRRRREQSWSVDGMAQECVTALTEHTQLGHRRTQPEARCSSSLLSPFHRLTGTTLAINDDLPNVVVHSSPRRLRPEWCWEINPPQASVCRPSGQVWLLRLSYVDRNALESSLIYFSAQTPLARRDQERSTAKTITLCRGTTFSSSSSPTASSLNTLNSPGTYMGRVGVLSKRCRLRGAAASWTSRLRSEVPDSLIRLISL